MPLWLIASQNRPPGNQNKIDQPRFPACEPNEVPRFFRALRVLRPQWNALSVDKNVLQLFGSRWCFLKNKLVFHDLRRLTMICIHRPFFVPIFSGSEQLLWLIAPLLWLIRSLIARNMHHLTRLERFLGTSAWLAISATIASGDFNRCCEKRGGHTYVRTYERE